jgi:acyl phosphate:glycerol-3-phosphate acyltransferase
MGRGHRALPTAASGRYNTRCMTTQAILLLLIPIAYLAGSIPFGLIVGRAKGIDPRTAGSGNIGATNLGRLLGLKYFFIVFILDLLKGLLPMAAASWVLCREGPAGDRTALVNVLHLLIGLASICGHMFSMFLKFTGGKGVATSTGVALGLYPFFTVAGLGAMAVWIVVFMPLRYVSLASIIAAAAFPVTFVVVGRINGWDPFGHQLPLLLFSILVAVLIVVRHRSNIARLRAGTENRISRGRGK